MMMRKKREAVEGKLRAVLERQRAQGISESSVRPKASGTSEPPPRTEFPKRRKTHWDRLLQEMNWMATDFIEERKWKASAGRTLSSALRSSEFARGTSPKKASNPEPCVKTEKEEVKLQDNDAKMHNKPNSVTCATKYLEPSVEERREAKKKSSLISTMISELAIAIK
jgi:nucleotidyltransferase/DNA polymerase involved in DNA repair